jgi:hypothetical protein
MMLYISLSLAKTTRRMVRFEAGTNGRDGILYISKPVWDVMGRPNRVGVELTPEKESIDEGHYQDP